jgi:hypothetical protein
VTSPQQTTSKRSGTDLDFTMMYATHDAFRRDLGRLLAASVAGTTDTRAFRSGWENFKYQLLVHHEVEDTALWPRVRRAVAGRPHDLAVAEKMESEHARLDPLLVAAEQALATPGSSVSGHAQELAAVLCEHLDHEEKDGLALIQSVLTQRDWRAFARVMRRRQGIKGAAIYVPWVLDDLPPSKQQNLLALLPAPVRILNRLLWTRRYQLRHLWFSS